MVPLDVTSEDSVTEAVRLVRERTDRLDVLINNAGASGNVIHPAEAAADEVHAVFNTNVYGPIRVTRGFLRLAMAASSPLVARVPVRRLTTPYREMSKVWHAGQRNVS